MTKPAAAETAPTRKKPIATFCRTPRETFENTEVLVFVFIINNILCICITSIIAHLFIEINPLGLTAGVDVSIGIKKCRTGRPSKPAVLRGAKTDRTTPLAEGRSPAPTRPRVVLGDLEGERRVPLQIKKDADCTVLPSLDTTRRGRMQSADVWAESPKV